MLNQSLESFIVISIDFLLRSLSLTPLLITNGKLWLFRRQFDLKKTQITLCILIYADVYNWLILNLEVQAGGGQL